MADMIGGRGHAWMVTDENIQGGRHSARGKIDYKDLEDRYLKVKDENLALKKKNLEQEKNLKKLATKLIRIKADLKKRGDASGKPVSSKDIDQEEMIQDLKAQIRELHKRNEALSNKVTYFKQMNQVQGARPSPYGHVEARVDTGIPHKKGTRAPSPRTRTPRASSAPRSRAARPASAGARRSPARRSPMKAAFGGFEDAAANMHGTLSVVRRKLLESENARQKLENEVTRLQAKVDASGGFEEIDLLALQKELKEKAAQVSVLHNKYDHLNASFMQTNQNHKDLLQQTEQLNSQLRDERSSRLELEHKLKMAEMVRTRIQELEAIVSDLRNERDVLETENKKLMASVIQGGSAEVYNDRMRRVKNEHEKQVTMMEARIEQLESQLEARTTELKRLQDQMKSLGTDHDDAVAEKDQTNIKLFELQHELDIMQEKLALFSEDSGIDQAELARALAYVKGQASGGEGEGSGAGARSSDPELKRKCDKLELEKTELVQEVSRLQTMMQHQSVINQQSKKILDNGRLQVGTVTRQYEKKLEDQARLLDQRSDKIRKLEAQLKNHVMANYRKGGGASRGGDLDGARDDPAIDLSGYESGDSQMSALDEGENALEFYIGQVKLNPAYFATNDPATFFSFDFFEHETQLTPIISGLRPSFRYTAVFVTKVEDFFLHYLQNQTMQLQLVQSYVSDYSIIGACAVSFSELLERPGKIITTGQIISDKDRSTVLGTVEFVMKMRTPITHEVRVYHERSAFEDLLNQKRKAKLLHSSTDDAGVLRATGAMYPFQNEVVVNVVSCQGLVPRRVGVKPSPYVYYEFYDYPGIDSSIQPHTYSPYFDDRKMFAVEINNTLRDYLKTKSIDFVVFDDKDPKVDANLGIASVPIAGLLKNEFIEGEYPILDEAGTRNGTIKIEISWLHDHGINPPRVPRDEEMAAMALEIERQRKLEEAALPPRSKPKKSDIEASKRMAEEERASLVNVDAFKYRPGVDPEDVRRSMEQGDDHEDRKRSDKKKKKDKKDRKKDRKRKKDKKRRKHRDYDDDDSVQSASSTSSTKSDSYSSEDSTTSEGRVRTSPKKKTSTRSPKRSPKKSPKKTPKSSKKGKRGDDSDASDDSEKSSHDDADSAGSGGAIPTQVPGSVPKPTRSESPIRTVSVTKPEDIERAKSRFVQDDVVPGGDEDPLATRLRSSGGTLAFRVSQDHRSPDRTRTPSPMRWAPKTPTTALTVSIGELVVRPSIANNAEIGRLFIAYDFLDVAGEDLETVALPKHDAVLKFNFTKMFPVDALNNKSQRDRLLQILKSADDSEADIVFSIVNEPPSGGECYEIGIAEINLQIIAKLKEDLINEELEVVDDEGVVVGSLFVTVLACDAIAGVLGDQPVGAITDGSS